MVMSKIAIKSIFQEISELVFKATTLHEAQTIVIEFVNTKNINDKDKIGILRACNESKTLFKLQNYICNSLLKYEGMSLASKAA